MRRGAAALAALAALAGCGGGKSGGPKDSGALRWSRGPQVVKVAGLPRDRVAIGAVRNASKSTIVLDARTVRLRDPAGRAVPADARWLGSFAHGIFSPQQFHDVQNPFELARLGVRIELAPGATRDLTVAWRLRPGGRAPVSVDYGGGRLSLPAG